MVIERLGITFYKTYTDKISEMKIDSELNKLRIEANDVDIIYCKSIRRLERIIDHISATCDLEEAEEPNALVFLLQNFK